jgi:hypothetical protein
MRGRRTAVNKVPSHHPSAIAVQAQVNVAVLALRADVVDGGVQGAEHGGGTDTEASTGQLL